MNLYGKGLIPVVCRVCIKECKIGHYFKVFYFFIQIYLKTRFFRKTYGMYIVDVRYHTKQCYIDKKKKKNVCLSRIRENQHAKSFI